VNSEIFGGGTSIVANKILCTLPETDILAPENGRLEDYFPFLRLRVLKFSIVKYALNQHFTTSNYQSLVNKGLIAFGQMTNLLATHCSIARSTCHQDFGIENMGGESKEGHDELPTQTTNKILRSLVGGFNPSEKH